MTTEQFKINSIYWTTLMFFLAGAILIPVNKSWGASALELFERKCSLCHSIDRPKSKKKSPEEWKNTVMRMKNKNGCPISDKEAEIIIKYLAENYGT